jgi:hypothetical protein
LDDDPTPGEMLLISLKVAALGLALIDLLLIFVGDPQ